MTTREDDWLSRQAPCFWTVVVLHNGKPSRVVAMHAKRMEVMPSGALCLFATDGLLLRAFAPGTWADAYSTSCLNGDPMGFDQEVDLHALRRR